VALELTNWLAMSPNSAASVHYPTSVVEVQELVARLPRVRALGARHSFNPIADSPGGALISLSRLVPEVTIDAGHRLADRDQQWPAGRGDQLVRGKRVGIQASVGLDVTIDPQPGVPVALKDVLGRPPGARKARPSGGGQGQHQPRHALVVVEPRLQLADVVLVRDGEAGRPRRPRGQGDRGRRLGRRPGGRRPPGDEGGDQLEDQQARRDVPPVVRVGSSLDPSQLGSDGIMQLIEVNPEGRQQEPGRTPVAVGQANIGDDLPVPPRPPHHVRGLSRILTDT
jgi:hypothetical protein